jgi:beta-lactamase superfamily II metal-dependent hydrolase
MATKKTTKKTAKKAVKKIARKRATTPGRATGSKTSKKSATKKSATRKGATKAGKKAATKAGKKAATKAGKKAATKGGGRGKPSGLRVRMYRIGFGDFFLVTVPTKNGPQHILIDCGVHAGNIGTMDECVKDMAQETGKKLALVIATHYHADHLSGFATNYDDFAEFEVGAVWITNRLDPGNKDAHKFQGQIKSLAHQLRLGLAERQLRLGADGKDDLAGTQAIFKMENALGITLGAAGGGNDKALRLLTEGFKNKPPVYYYQGGDVPTLPDSLEGAIDAQLLGPSPKDSGGVFSGSDNKKEQYLAAAADEGLPETECLAPFEKEWPATAYDYPPDAFKSYGGSPEGLEKILHAAQPDVLLAMADALDGTLNNQSLVILFTCKGKKLLFVGDAQWGNWSYWLYGKKVTGKDPGITERAKEILGSIDFYKVGHHGSTNATPIPAAAALSDKCVSMCSTESADYDPKKKRPYGDPKKGTEVPRTKLMDALEKQTKDKLVRSDWIAVSSVPASPEAKSELAKLPANFSAGDLYLDYIFPA